MIKIHLIQSLLAKLKSPKQISALKNEFGAVLEAASSKIPSRSSIVLRDNEPPVAKPAVFVSARHSIRHDSDQSKLKQPAIAVERNHRLINRVEDHSTSVSERVPEPALVNAMPVNVPVASNSVAVEKETCREFARVQRAVSATPNGPEVTPLNAAGNAASNVISDSQTAKSTMQARTMRETLVASRAYRSDSGTSKSFAPVVKEKSVEVRSPVNKGTSIITSVAERSVDVVQRVVSEPTHSASEHTKTPVANKSRNAAEYDTPTPTRIEVRNGVGSDEVKTRVVHISNRAKDPLTTQVKKVPRQETAAAIVTDVRSEAAAAVVRNDPEPSVPSSRAEVSQGQTSRVMNAEGMIGTASTYKQDSRRPATEIRAAQRDVRAAEGTRGESQTTLQQTEKREGESVRDEKRQVMPRAATEVSIRTASIGRAQRETAPKPKIETAAVHRLHEVMTSEPMQSETSRVNLEVRREMAMEREVRPNIAHSGSKTLPRSHGADSNRSDAIPAPIARVTDKPNLREPALTTVPNSRAKVSESRQKTDESVATRTTTPSAAPVPQKVPSHVFYSAVSTTPQIRPRTEEDSKRDLTQALDAKNRGAIKAHPTDLTQAPGEVEQRGPGKIVSMAKIEKMSEDDAIRVEPRAPGVAPKAASDTDTLMPMQEKEKTLMPAFSRRLSSTEPFVEPKVSAAGDWPSQPRKMVVHGETESVTSRPVQARITTETPRHAAYVESTESATATVKAVENELAHERSNATPQIVSKPHIDGVGSLRTEVTNSAIQKVKEPHRAAANLAGSGQTQDSRATSVDRRPVMRQAATESSLSSRAAATEIGSARLDEKSFRRSPDVRPLFDEESARPVDLAKGVHSEVKGIRPSPESEIKTDPGRRDSKAVVEHEPSSRTYVWTNDKASEARDTPVERREQIGREATFGKSDEAISAASTLDKRPLEGVPVAASKSTPTITKSASALGSHETFTPVLSGSTNSEVPKRQFGAQLQPVRPMEEPFESVPARIIERVQETSPRLTQRDTEKAPIEQSRTEASKIEMTTSDTRATIQQGGEFPREVASLPKFDSAPTMKTILPWREIQARIEQALEQSRRKLVEPDLLSLSFFTQDLGSFDIEIVRDHERLSIRVGGDSHVVTMMEEEKLQFVQWMREQGYQVERVDFSVKQEGQFAGHQDAAQQHQPHAEPSASALSRSADPEVVRGEEASTIELVRPKASGQRVWTA